MYLMWFSQYTAGIAINNKGKRKIKPRTRRESPEGEWSYSSSLSLTTTLDGGGWSTSYPGRFTYGKDPVIIV